VFERPSHPYAIGLLEAFPSVKAEEEAPSPRIAAGSREPAERLPVPSSMSIRAGHLHAGTPQLIEVDAGHRSRCHFAKEIFSGSLA